MYLQLTVGTVEQAAQVQSVCRSAVLQFVLKNKAILNIPCKNDASRKCFLKRLENAEEEGVLDFAFNTVTVDEKLWPCQYTKEEAPHVPEKYLMKADGTPGKGVWQKIIVPAPGTASVKGR